MIVVTAPTGQIGSRLVTLLLAHQAAVRVVARDPRRLDPAVRDRVEVVPGSHADPRVLADALAGADALFWLTPPDPRAPSALEHYLAFARAGAAAVRRHAVGHVVAVSSAGHQHPKPAGVLSAAFAMDEEFATSGAAYRGLALPFFMDNLLSQAAALRDGALTLTAAADKPFACIAARDVAAAAAGLLLDRAWSGQENVPYFGPDRLTPTELARVLGDALGRPVTYRRTPLDDLAAALRGTGASDRAVADIVEMLAAVDDGSYDDDWAGATLTGTPFADWCREVLRPAVDGPE